MLRWKLARYFSFGVIRIFLAFPERPFCECWAFVLFSKCCLLPPPEPDDGPRSEFLGAIDVSQLPLASVLGVAREVPSLAIPRPNRNLRSLPERCSSGEELVWPASPPNPRLFVLSRFSRNSFAIVMARRAVAVTLRRQSLPCPTRALKALSTSLANVSLCFLIYCSATIHKSLKIPKPSIACKTLRTLNFDKTSWIKLLENCVHILFRTRHSAKFRNNTGKEGKIR